MNADNNPIHELPPPSAEALAHSLRLQELLVNEITTSGGCIGFDRFMELALYAPGLGYYSAGSHKFGESGDFVTAPVLSSLFSRCLAKQCEQVMSELGGGDVLEFGAGSGVMAADILAELERLDSLPGRYLILEVSADLRERQQQTINDKVPHLSERVQWLNGLPEAGFRGVVLANEVLDAMPVMRFTIRDGAPHECCVTHNEGAFAWQESEAGPVLRERVQQLMDDYALEEGYTSEINLNAEEWVRSLTGFLEQGVALLIDYGFPQREFYHPQRSDGTLMCHYRHRAHDNPLLYLGLQDITAHVDFTAVAEAALIAGLEVRGYTNQAAFLIANGLTELLAEVTDDMQQHLTLSAQAKRLTMPGEMGELFKVMALTKGWRGGLRGFSLRDDRVNL